MGVKARVTFAIAVVALMATATAAWANGGAVVTLFSGPSAGYYGQDCMLLPQVNVETKVVPGPKLKADLFEFQLKNSKGVWEKYEDQLVEETGTVDPPHAGAGRLCQVPRRLPRALLPPVDGCKRHRVVCSAEHERAGRRLATEARREQGQHLCAQESQEKRVLHHPLHRQAALRCRQGEGDR